MVAVAGVEPVRELMKLACSPTLPRIKFCFTAYLVVLGQPIPAVEPRGIVPGLMTGLNPRRVGRVAIR
jgi:hypothetical protein